MLFDLLFPPLSAKQRGVDKIWDDLECFFCFALLIDLILVGGYWPCLRVFPKSDCHEIWKLMNQRHSWSTIYVVCTVSVLIIPKSQQYYDMGLIYFKLASP